jgi:predicted DNA-binding protein with PD1-like motif
MSPTCASPGTFHAFRLRPHQDLKVSLLQFARENNIAAGAIVTCVGSLERLELRFANQSTAFVSNGPFEILSLSGTFSNSAGHLHLAVANQRGETLGGHLLDNNLVFTTAEIVVVSLEKLEFAREVDRTYGYHELVVKSRD